METRLPGRIRKVVQEWAERLRSELGQNLEEIRLYGSWARAEAHRNSDVDLAVIVRNDDLATWQLVQHEAAQLSLEHDMVLSVRLLSRHEWEEMCRLQTLYARELQEDGVPL